MRLTQLQNSYLYEGLDQTTSTSMMLWESAGFKLKEAALTADQIQQIFQSVEQGATAAGGNRTLIGKGKDAASAVNKAWEDLKTKVQNSGPIQNVDKKYDDVVAKIEKSLGGPDNAISKVIMGYRKFAKEHPIAQGLIYSALIAAAGISGAGLGGAAVLGLLKMTDKLLQGEKFSSAAYSGAKTGAMAYGASKLGDYLKGKPEGGDTATDAAANAGQIKGAGGVAKEAERIFREKVAAGEITDYNSYQQGMQDSLEQAVKNAGGKISFQSQDTASHILKARLDSVAAKAAGGEFSGSGPDKVKAVIDAMGGQADAGKIDAANQAVKTLSGASKSAASSAAQANFDALDKASLAQSMKIDPMLAQRAGYDTISDVATKGAGAAADAATSAPFGAGMDPGYLQRVVDAGGKSGVRFKISPEDAAKALDWQAQNGGNLAAGAAQATANSSMGNIIGNADLATRAGRQAAKDAISDALSSGQITQAQAIKMAKEVGQGAFKAAKGESFVWTGKQLSEGQVYLVFNRVCSLNNAMLAEGRLVEGPIDAIKGAAGKAVGWLATKGKNLTTKVTADKLNSAWQKAGAPTDSDELASFLQSQGVDAGVLDKVYSDLKIPTLSSNPANKEAEPEQGQAQTPADLEKIKAMIAKLPTDRKVRLLKYLTKAAPAPEAKPAPAKDELGRIEPTMA